MEPLKTKVKTLTAAAADVMIGAGHAVIYVAFNKLMDLTPF